VLAIIIAVVATFLLTRWWYIRRIEYLEIALNKKPPPENATQQDKMTGYIIGISSDSYLVQVPEALEAVTLQISDIPPQFYNQLWKVGQKLPLLRTETVEPNVSYEVIPPGGQPSSKESGEEPDEPTTKTSLTK